jgi:hypothetical protein
VHLVDTWNGRVFWDANYNMALIPGIGAPTLKGYYAPDLKNPGTMPVMNKMWIEKTDPGPHLFDLSIETRENWYDDQNDTPWGADEGFDKRLGANAHIGIEVFRRPKLLPSGDGTREMIRKNRRQSSNADLHNSWGSMDPARAQYLRVVHGEENIFKDVKTGDPGNLYYGWIIKKDARTRNNYEYLFPPKNTIPAIVEPYTFTKYEVPEKPKGGGASTGAASGMA